MKDEYEMLKKENQALRLLLQWAIECDFGFDNFVVDDDCIDISSPEWENETKNMSYLDTMVLYAKKYLEKIKRWKNEENRNI